MTAPRDDRRVRPADLGAWLLKGNADRADLAARFARQPRVTRWCVQPSYRTRLMRAGQPVLFWASGSRNRLPYGIWGVGELAGCPALDPRDGRWHVPLDLTIGDPDTWVPRRELRADPRLTGLEVLRQPQAANPSFVTATQFEAVTEYLTGCICDPAGLRPRGAPPAGTA